VRAVRLILLAGVAFHAGPALAADALKFGPPPAWVVPGTAPAVVSSSEAPIAMLYNDQQISMESGHIVTYSESVMRIQNPQGLAAGNISLAWNPAIETVTVNKLQIRRGDKVIDVLASGQTFTVLRRETNLDAATLDGTLTGNIQPEGLQVGDIIDMAVTNEHSDSVLKGHVEGLYAPWNALPFAAARARLSWPTSTPMNWRQSADLPPARTTRSGSTTLLELTGKNIQPLIAPTGAPLYREAAVIAPSGSLRDELNRIRSSTNDLKSRAAQALQLVQDRTGYVALVMGQGSLVPASAETTWTRRFGDCKAKTALLLALLHELGIEAEPVLVNSGVGDLIGDRLPMVQLFNHVLVRAHIGASAYWLDGTRSGDRSLDEIDVPEFTWGLPLIADAKLVSIVPPPLDVPTKERFVDIDASGGIFTPAKTNLHELYRGDAAVALNSLYSQLTAAQRDEALRGTATSYFDDFAVTTSSVQFNEAKRQFDIKISGTAKLDWKNEWFFVPTSSIAFDPDFDRPAGAFHDAPVQIGYPRFVRDIATVRLPAGVAATQKLDAPVSETLAGVEYRRSETVSGDTITVLSSERGIVPEIPYKEALAAKSRLKTINDDNVYLRVPRAYRMSPDDTKARLAESPSSAEEYFERGTLLLNVENYDTAISDFDESLKLKPNDEWALANRGIAYASKKNLSAAEKDLGAAEAINPNNPVAAQARALLAEDSGDFKGAVAAYSKSILSDPNNNWALGHRAIARKAANDDEGALADSAVALSKDPAWMNLRLLRANIFFVRGDKAAVAREAELVTKENPKSEYAWVSAGRIYARLDRRTEAMKAFDQAIAIKPAAYVYINRAQSRPFSDKAGRLADLDAALKIEPENSDVLAEKAEQLAADGDLKGALAIYDQVTKVQPDSEFYAERRAILLYKTGRKSEAEAFFAAQRAKAKTSSDYNGMCWNNATAGIFLDAALLDCRRALQIKPDYPAAMDSLAFVLLRLGKIDESIAEYTLAIAKSPGSASYMGRSLAYAKKGDKAHADADRAEALRLDGDAEIRFAEYGLKR
jgi:tetratricopeptide (TPR) repeat protein